MTQSFLRISGEEPVPERLRGSVVAIGNFDGIHRGHQAVLERALEEAQRRGVAALVLSAKPSLTPDQVASVPMAMVSSMAPSTTRMMVSGSAYQLTSRICVTKAQEPAMPSATASRAARPPRMPYSTI